MAVEIERKFLVNGRPWVEWGQGTLYKQGYASKGTHLMTRVRIAGDQGFLTLKGKTEGVQRLEFEYEIPLVDAQELLDLCEGAVIEKYRWVIPFKSMIWEVDVFLGQNQGLVVAEIELESVDQTIEYPSWIGQEVSHDPRYFNGALSQYPWTQWPENQRLINQNS